MIYFYISFLSLFPNDNSFLQSLIACGFIGQFPGFGAFAPSASGFLDFLTQGTFIKSLSFNLARIALSTGFFLTDFSIP